MGYANSRRRRNRRTWTNDSTEERTKGELVVATRITQSYESYYYYPSSLLESRRGFFA
jgi:hypothetical protein